MNKLFESQWERTKEILLEGKDLRFNQDGTENTNKVSVMDTILQTNAMF